jgi:hypothetical protein
MSGSGYRSVVAALASLSATAIAADEPWEEHRLLGPSRSV